MDSVLWGFKAHIAEAGATGPHTHTPHRPHPPHIHPLYLHVLVFPCTHTPRPTHPCPCTCAHVYFRTSFPSPASCSFGQSLSSVGHPVLTRPPREGLRGVGRGLLAPPSCSQIMTHPPEPLAWVCKLGLVPALLASQGGTSIPVRYGSVFVNGGLFSSGRCCCCLPSSCRKNSSAHRRLCPRVGSGVEARPVPRRCWWAWAPPPSSFAGRGPGSGGAGRGLSHPALGWVREFSKGE